MKVLFVLMALVTVSCVTKPSEVFGGSSHHDSTTVIHHTDTTSNETKGIALAIAKSQHQFFDTRSTQGSLGLGGFNGKNAISFGVARRIGKDGMLLNGSVGVEEGEVGYGAGINWRFK